MFIVAIFLPLVCGVSIPKRVSEVLWLWLENRVETRAMSFNP